MRTLLLIAIAATLAACASEPKQASNNREWITVSCSGAVGWKACSDKGMQLCPNGFDIANKEENLITGLRSYQIACKR
jgi:hypothetical protein